MTDHEIETDPLWKKLGDSMTSRSISALAFRVLALLAVLAAIGPGARNLPLMVQTWPYDAEGGSPLLMAASIVAPIVLPLVFGGLLWLVADRLAQNVVHDAGTDPSLSYDALQELAFSIIGLALVAFAIPDLSKLVYYYWQLSTSVGVQLGNDVARKAALIGVTVQIALGLWLVFGAAGFASLLRRLRGG
jgi:hypothetical protein